MGFLSGTKDSKTGSSAQNTTPCQLQTILRTSRRDDPSEIEADRIAERITAKTTEEELTGPALKVADEQPEELKPRENEEEESLQRQSEEDEPEEADVDMQEEEDGIIQGKAVSTEGIKDPQVRELLRTGRGAGSPMEPGLARQMEGHFGRSFSDVRIHTDSTAVRLCELLGARAFTYGQDIYFSEGAYQPDTREGRKLIAHELTHVVQQRRGAKTIQRQSERTNQKKPVDATKLSERDGRLVRGTDRDRIFFDKIEVPGFKLKDYREHLYKSRYPLIHSKGYKRGNPRQRDVWQKSVNKEKIMRRIREVLQRGYRSDSINDNETHLVKVPVRGERASLYYSGTIAEIADRLTIPEWGGMSLRPPYRFFHVDHIVELQLANWNNDRWANTPANMELLEAGFNMASGSIIKNKINEKVRHFLNVTKGPDGRSPYGRSIKDIKKNYELVFRKAEPLSEYRNVARTRFWKKDEIENASHLRPLRPALLSELGGNGYVRIFPSETGGLGMRFRWPEEVPSRSRERGWLKSPFQIKQKHFNTKDEDVTSHEFGHFVVNIEPNHSVFEGLRGGDFRIPILRFGGAQFAGHIEKTSVLRMLHRLKIKRTSPIAVDTFHIHGKRGIILQGRILPEVPLFRDADIRFSLENGDFTLSKTFTIDEITLPPPFSVSTVTLTLFGSTRRGIGIDGRIEFAIKGLGEGYIAGVATTSQSLELEGEFNFDSRLFDPAVVSVSYRNRTLTAEGELGIPQGKLRGIKSANIRVLYSESEGRLTASGTAELNIPGVRSAMVNVLYTGESFTVEGTAELKDDIPGIRGGSVTVRVQKEGEESGYRLYARGEAIPSIPGIDAKLGVEYNDGAITIHGRVGYRKGMLSGEVDVTVSNRRVDEEGNPTDELTDRLTLYGGGELTVQFTRWLKGTAGVRFLPTGELQVSGRIGIPSTVEVFGRKAIPERDLFRLGFDIPIFAIPVGPKSIGLVATIRGALRAYAGIGPGRLEELELSVVYTPTREEDTRISGRGKFIIPADAGLKLAISASVGVSAVIGGAEGGFEIAGGIKLSAKADASVNVNWTPSTGIELNARLSAGVEPKFTFDIEGFVRAWALGLEKRKGWNLVSYEYGSNMRFGVYLPIRYREGEPFDISFEDIRFERPQISEGFLKGLIRDIKNKNS